MLTRCEQFGFDEKNIQRRLALLRLNERDHALVAQIQEVILRPNIDSIINRFYETLLFNAETRIFIISGDIIERLKETQRKYILEFGVGFDREEYFAKRLHVGTVHAAIELPLNTYLCAFNILNQIFTEHIPESIFDDASSRVRLLICLNKIIALDMSLAIEAYHSAQISDMTETVEELHHRETDLIKIAETDSLTELYNRATVFRALGDVVASRQQTNTSLHVLMIDIDHFKKINDTHGHQAGDLVIRSIAKRISYLLRTDDIVGRYGGEEFIVGLINLDRLTAINVAERIRSSIAEKPIKGLQKPIHVSVSIGLSVIENDDTLESLISKADRMLYQAKHSGRNRVVADS